MFEGIPYTFDAKFYDFPSKYGINKGHISKLVIFSPKGRYIAEYEREWIIKPRIGSNEEKIYELVLRELDLI